MPELPDVEDFRRYMAATSLHKKITEVNVYSPEILQGVTASQLKERLKGKDFEEARRHGKYLAACLQGGDFLVMHFGMTGFLKYFMNPEKEPPHERLLMSFKNGYHLAYDCQRKLGEVHLVEDFDRFIKEKALGPDALSPDLDVQAFQQLIVGRRGSIKSVLMNQEVLAGIGNIYADEILFQAQVHPKTPANRLSDDELGRLFAAREEVLNTAVAHQANPEEFPGSFITRIRGKNGKCPKCGDPLTKITVSGRTAYYCPTCQKP